MKKIIKKSLSIVVIPCLFIALGSSIVAANTTNVVGKLFPGLGSCNEGKCISSVTFVADFGTNLKDNFLKFNIKKDTYNNFYMFPKIKKYKLNNKLDNATVKCSGDNGIYRIPGSNDFGFKCNGESGEGNINDLSVSIFSGGDDALYDIYASTDTDTAKNYMPSVLGDPIGINDSEIINNGVYDLKDFSLSTESKKVEGTETFSFTMLSSGVSDSVPSTVFNLDSVDIEFIIYGCDNELSLTANDFNKEDKFFIEKLDDCKPIAAKNPLVHFTSN